jgi:LPXTG-site transpeptidase (sortase) family protein
MRWVERLLLMIGLVGASWFATGEIHAVREQAALARGLEAARRAAAASATAPYGSSSSSSVSRPSPPVALATRALVGRIEVPRLRLSALAREGVDVRTLRGSVGHVPGTAMPGAPGNAAFAAHRDTFFRPLEGIRPGDAILITTPEGVHRYIVVGTRVVPPSDVSVLRSGNRSQLTLVTCYPFDYVGSAPQRFIVQAELAPAPARSTAAAH